MNPRKFVPLLLVVAGLWVYHNSLSTRFVFDDTISIQENSSIRHLWPIWNALTPLPSSLVAGRPVVSFSLALNYALGGLSVRGYHAFNLAIHILAGLTLYGVVRRTLLQPALQEQFGQSATRIAMAVAVLWVVHPLQTEAVTYVSQRCESLMGLFYLLTLYGFIRGVDSQESGWWFTFATAACLLGMASKEVMVTAPVMVLLYDRTFVSRSFREAWTRHGRLYLGLAGTWLLLGYLMLGLSNRGVGFGLGIPWWAYGLTESRAVVRYLCLALWPHPLIFDYGDEDIAIRHFSEAAPYLLIIAVLGVAVLLALRRRPSLGFVGAWFFLILAPASSVIPVANQPMAEHRMYLPLAAVVMLVVLGINFWMGWRSVVVFFFMAIGLVFMTSCRNKDYYSDLALWSDTVAKRPNNPRAHCNLALALLNSGKIPEAIGEYEQALRIQPNYAPTHSNLGFIFAGAGDYEDAIKQYQEALRLDPKRAEVHINLAVALFAVGNAPGAIAQYQVALLIEPNNASTHNDLGLVLARSGKFDDAVHQYRAALRLQPDNPGTHDNLGLALARLGQFEEAVKQYQEALQLQPDNAAAHYHFGLASDGLEKYPDAIKQYQETLRLQPDDAATHNNIATDLVKTGRIEEAITHYEQALRIDPNLVEAHFNLGIALEKVGRVPEAIFHYEQALRLRPGLTVARNALGRLGVDP